MSGYARLLDISGFDARAMKRASKLVTAARREKALAFSDEGERRASIAAGLLLQYMLKMYCSEAAIVRYLPNGKPILIDNDGMHVSLSHSGYFCACAMSKAPVGIDVQEHCGSFPLIVKRIFTDEERRFIESAPGEDKDGQFYRLWCRKEAQLKAAGISDLRRTNALEEKAGWVFHDFVLDRASCSIYGERDSCPDSVSILSIGSVMESLACA